MIMSRLINLSGKVFGSWKVLSRDKESKGTNARWICICKCGTKKSVRSNHLLSNGSKSCGCLRERDLTGLKFNSWTVLNKIRKENLSEWSGNKYFCRCDCGNEKELLGGSLTTGASKTCGCWQVKDTRETALQSLFSATKNNAKRRNIEFSLSKEYFIEISEKCCNYCGGYPSQKFKVKNTKTTKVNREFIYIGIDRVDSREGYTKKNTVPCCSKCNFSKHSLSLDKWKIHLKKVCMHLGIL